METAKIEPLWISPVQKEAPSPVPDPLALGFCTLGLHIKGVIEIKY